VNSTVRIQVLLYTQQPFVARGFAAVLDGRRDFGLAACCDNLPRTLQCLRRAAPDVVLVHLASRISLSDLHELRSAAGRAQMVLWGHGLAGEFAFQAMQLGVHGILPAGTEVDALLAALQNVHRGVLCFERELLDSVLLQRRITLTKRQGQIVSLVSQGLKNKEIAFSLGITEGTVKVYLYNLFRKLGMNDRLDMALYGLKNLFAGEPELRRMPGAGRRVGHAADPFGPRSLPQQARERARLDAVN
jgi:two-component system nitrate/nitrite response regulator NarL